MKTKEEFEQAIKEKDERIDDLEASVDVRDDDSEMVELKGITALYDEL